MRLENGAGSVCVLSGNRRKKYAARVTVGWKDGKQVRKYIGYYKTPSEAMLALAEYANGGFNIDLSKLTLNEVYDLWIERIEKKDLSDSVLRAHQMAQSRFDKLGKLPIRNIKAIQLQTWLDGLDLKPGSKRRVRSTIKQLYAFALANDIVTKNYADTLEINEKTEKTGSIFTEQEIKTLWDNSNDDTSKLMLLLIYTGMRIGELLAVKREHINFEESYLVGGSKTEAGRNRVIPIHSKLMPFVKELLGNNEYLFESERGNSPIVYTTVVKRSKDLFDRFGMNHKLHDGRKTAVSIMHSNEIPMEIIRIIVGHSGKGVTEQVYLRKTPQELVKYINLIDIPYI